MVQLRCSKARPKCSNCEQWPGPCVYEQDTISAAPDRNRLPGYSNNQRPDDVAETLIPTNGHQNDVTVCPVVLESSTAFSMLQKYAGREIGSQGLYVPRGEELREVRRKHRDYYIPTTEEGESWIRSKSYTPWLDAVSLTRIISDPCPGLL